MAYEAPLEASWPPLQRCMLEILEKLKILVFGRFLALSRISGSNVAASANSAPAPSFLTFLKKQKVLWQARRR